MMTYIYHDSNGGLHSTVMSDQYRLERCINECRLSGHLQLTRAFKLYNQLCACSAEPNMFSSLAFTFRRRVVARNPPLSHKVSEQDALRRIGVLAPLLGLSSQCLSTSLSFASTQ
jgi:hypothetical protein